MGRLPKQPLAWGRLTQSRTKKPKKHRDEGQVQRDKVRPWAAQVARRQVPQVGALHHRQPRIPPQLLCHLLGTRASGSRQRPVWLHVASVDSHLCTCSCSKVGCMLASMGSCTITLAWCLTNIRGI